MARARRRRRSAPQDRGFPVEAGWMSISEARQRENRATSCHRSQGPCRWKPFGTAEGDDVDRHQLLFNRLRFGDKALFHLKTAGLRPVLPHQPPSRMRSFITGMFFHVQRRPAGLAPGSRRLRYYTKHKQQSRRFPSPWQAEGGPFAPRGGWARSKPADGTSNC